MATTHSELSRQALRALLAALLLGSAASFAQGPLTGTEDSPPRFEVLVLGTIHAPWQFRGDGFTPAHVRAALRLAGPDVIGVESNPQWFAKDTFHDVTYEAQAIAVPFAAEHGIPVHGVDWMDIESWDRQEQQRLRTCRDSLLAMRRSGRLGLWSFGQVAPEMLAETEAYFHNTFDFERVNDVGDDSYGRQWMIGDSDAPDFGGHRNQQIVANSVEAMKQHPGERLVVVIGAGHKAVLDRLFKRISSIKVLQLGTDVPVPTMEQIDRAWTPRDLLVTLGHNLDGERSYYHPELIDLPRMSRLTRRLAEIPGHEPAARYFQARIAYAGGDLDTSERLLDDLARAEVRPELYPFPIDHWRMRYSFEQAVRLERGRCALERGDLPGARALLAPLKQSLPTAPAVPELPPRHAVSLLADPGFEALPAARPGAGWYMPPIWAGQLKIRSDTERPIAGNRSLAVEIKAPRDEGMYFLSQQIPIAQELRGDQELTLAVQLRGTRGVTANLSAYVLLESERRMRELASQPITVAIQVPTEARLRFQVPAAHEDVHLYIYFNGPPDSTLWLDDAQTFAGPPEAPVPSDWCAWFLAHELPGALLRQAGVRD